MPSGDGHTISVIVPVYNGGAEFVRCLESLYQSEVKPSEIIVVSDADTDGSWKVAEEFGAKVLRLPENRGPAAARNRGAKEAVGDILLFVDADVAVRPDTVGRVLTAFDEDEDLAAAFGSYDDEPGSPNFLSQYKNLFHHYIHQSAKEDASTFFTGLGAVRREVFFELGGFNEAQRYLEDIDLGYRLKDAGHRIRLVKDLQARHLKRWGVLSLLGSDLFGRALPWTGLIFKYGRFTDDLNIKISSRVSVALAWGLLLLGAGSLFLRGLILPAVLFILALVVLNNGLYRFFLKKRGVLFTLVALPWHWLYFLYSGLGFALGAARYFRRRRDTANSNPKGCTMGPWTR